MTTHPPENVPSDFVAKALRRAYSLGQTYWQQADSESWTQNKKADITRASFDELVKETDSLLAKYAAPATVGVPDGWKLVPVEPDCMMWTAGGDVVTTQTGKNGKNDIASLVYSAMLAASPTAPAGEVQEPEYYDSEKRCRAYYESGLRPYLCDGMRYDHWQAVWMAAQYDISMRPNNSEQRPHPAPQAAQSAESVEPVAVMQEVKHSDGIPRQFLNKLVFIPTGTELYAAPVAAQSQPAFYGFRDDANCRVDICYTPGTPRTDGVYATPYYTAKTSAQDTSKPAQGDADYDPCGGCGKCTDCLAEEYSDAQPAQDERAVVAHRLLRRNGSDEWVNDAKQWCDGLPPSELIRECTKYPERYKIEYAYRAALSTPAADGVRITDAGRAAIAAMGKGGEQS